MLQLNTVDNTSSESFNYTFTISLVKYLHYAIDYAFVMLFVTNIDLYFMKST
jgi:hypothetical protein